MPNFTWNVSELLAAVDAGERRLLGRFGAFVRQAARRSMPRKKGISPPGAPPFAHTGGLKNRVLFAVDPVRGSVTIGAATLRNGERPGALLEHGGQGRRGRYRPRPFMQPAFAAVLGDGRLSDDLRSLLRG
jgi:hypothetical protein